jgi:hypothetical protein
MQANLRRFEEAQAQSQGDKRRDDNITWDLFNKTSDSIFGLDYKKVPEQYKRYIKLTYGQQELAKLEHRCVRRSRAELREIAALAKPSTAQARWFKDKMDAGVKTGPELHGQLDENN